MLIFHIRPQLLSKSSGAAAVLAWIYVEDTGRDGVFVTDLISEAAGIEAATCSLFV